VSIFDDTIQEKAWTDESNLVCWHFDHCCGRTVRGINLLNALYYCKGTSIAVALKHNRLFALSEEDHRESVADTHSKVKQQL
jgi:hypothetical protein